MRTRRTPFYGDPQDRELLGPSFKLIALDEMTDIPPAALELVGSMGDGSELADYELPSDIPQPALKPLHPDAVEKGAAIPLGFMPHDGENRTQRRAAAATWVPPVLPEGEQPPTRRALWKQRQRQRRGKLDPELRRLQQRKAKAK